MINELERLLSNAHAPHDALCFSSVVVMKDGQTFGGVTVKNNIFRDAIYAEQVAFASAIAEGYKKEDFKELHVAGSGKEICVPCFLCRELLVEFMDEDASVFCYNNKGKCVEYKVKDLCPHPFKLEAEDGK